MDNLHLILNQRNIVAIYLQLQLMEAGVSLRTGPPVQQPALPMRRHKYAAEDVSVQLLRMVGNTVKVMTRFVCLIFG